MGRGIPVRLRPIDLATIFEVYIIAVALGALKTALDTTTPWYDATTSFWAYATTFLGSLVLASVLVLTAVALARPRGLSAAPSTSATPSAAPNPGPSRPRSQVTVDEEMDDLLKSLERTAGFGSQAEGTPPGAGTVQLSAGRTSVVETSPQRAAGRRRVRTALVGPSITAAIFGGVSAIALPAASGFMQANWTLNTFLILLFSYGWAGLLAYSVGSIFFAAAEA